MTQSFNGLCRSVKNCITNTYAATTLDIYSHMTDTMQMQKEIQHLRRNPRPVRIQARRDDLRKESGDCARESKTKRGCRLRRPQKLCQKWQRLSKPIEKCIEI